MTIQANPGQRGFTAILTVLLLIIGAILGEPGAFPMTEAGDLLTPEFLLEGGMPIGLFFLTIIQLYKRINQKVNDPDDRFQADSVLDLLKTREFWVSIITISVGILSIFGAEILENSSQQGLLVTMGMSMANFLLYDWNSRPSGHMDEPLTISS